nr:reverse transcriptase domain-containing protein [Tanacetum cinerariifolium]
MENTILELVEIFRQNKLYCMHDNVDDLIESALNSRLLLINLNSQRLDKKKQEVKNVVEQPTERETRIVESLQNFRIIHKSSISLNNTSQISPVHAVAPILSTKEPEYSLSMGYEHPNTTQETESDEIIKSSVEKLVPIPIEYEVTSEEKRECDELVCEDSSTFDVCGNHSEIFSDSNNDDDISSDDDAFEDIEYVEASLPDPEIVSIEEENVVHQEEEEFDLEEIKDIVLREKLLSINRLIANIESLNDNPTPDCVLNSFVSFSIFEESDNSLLDNSSPEVEIFFGHTEETRSGNTTTHADNFLPEYDSFCFEIEPDQERLINVVKNDISDDSTNHPLLEEANLFLASDNSIPPGIKNFAYHSEGDIRFLEVLLSNDSILFPNNESSESYFDNPSFLRPLSEPPDDEFDSEPEVISSVMKNIDELSKDECFDPGREVHDFTNVEDHDYFPFIFAIQNFLPYLIYLEASPLFLSAESEYTIFDPEIPSSEIKVHIEVLSVLWGNRLPIQMLVYGKACHLPIELEHKAYWALKHANFDLQTTSDHKKVQLNELNEFRDQAYEKSLIYKEKTKRLHD